MQPRRFSRVGRRFAGLLTMAIIAPRDAFATDQALLLAVRVNTYALDVIGEFVLRDGVLMAQRKELLELGFQVPDGPDRLIALSELKLLVWHLDAATQTLDVTTPDAGRVPARLAVAPPATARAPIESGTGVTLNYDVTGISVAGQSVGSGFFDLRAFSPWGVASTGMLGYLGGGPGGPGVNSAVRLDSTYTYSDVDALSRYRVGDFITGSLGWTRAIRMGGVQFTSDFALRPDLVTFPLPSIGGSVAVPSTLDVLVNGSRLMSRQISAGPFEIPQLPVVSGAGTVSMTVTNALGRPVVVNMPFYASAALLAPGLQTYSIEAGKVRHNWGIVSSNYGAFAASATYRRGLSDAITVEGSAQTSAGVTAGGGGLVVNIANLAIMNLAVAASSGMGRTGMQYSAGLQRAGTVFNLGVSATAANRNFQDIATANGDAVARLQLSANAGISLGQLGSIGVAYSAIDHYAAPAPIRVFIPPGTALADTGLPVGGFISFQPVQHAHVLSASYSVQLGDVSLYATGFRDFAKGGSSGVLVGMTIPLGRRSSAGASAGTGSGGRYGQIQVAQSATSVGDIGYQAYASRSTVGHEFAELAYKSPWALLTVGADRIDRQTSLRAQVQGAVSFVDGALLPSNTITDSFAVVDTGGLANIRVLHENRDAGATDYGGRLLVPDLRSFQRNRIDIEANDVPIDVTIDNATREVWPQDRSGVVVRFGVKISNGALLRLVDAAGAVLPVGSIAKLRSSGATVPVGYDGRAYIVDLGAHNDVSVERPDGRRCSVVFEYHAKPGEIPIIGPLPCL